MSLFHTDDTIDIDTTITTTPSDIVVVVDINKNSNNDDDEDNDLYQKNIANEFDTNSVQPPIVNNDENQNDQTPPIVYTDAKVIITDVTKAWNKRRFMTSKIQELKTHQDYNTIKHLQLVECVDAVILSFMYRKKKQLFKLEWKEVMKTLESAQWSDNISDFLKKNFKRSDTCSNILENHRQIKQNICRSLSIQYNNEAMFYTKII